MNYLKKLSILFAYAEEIIENINSVVGLKSWPFYTFTAFQTKSIILKGVPLGMPRACASLVRATTHYS